MTSSDYHPTELPDYHHHLQSIHNTTSQQHPSRIPTTTTTTTTTATTTTTTATTTTTTATTTTPSSNLIIDKAHQPIISSSDRPTHLDPNLTHDHQPSPKKSDSIRHRTYRTAFGPISLNQFLRKDWIKYYIIILILLVSIGLLAIYHHQVVIFLHPYVQSMRNLQINGFEIGWIIPILVLFIISFPPLLGHEVVIILCGLVWGLWFGFIIVSVGTLLGELANYWAFKYACSHRAAKLEKKDRNYACMCIVIREGGFWIAFLARLSAIPGHLITPVFATTGMSLFIFTAATVLTMPKQLAGVYLGTLFSEDGDGLPKSTSSSVVKYSVLAFSFIVTIFAALHIYKKIAQVRMRLDAQFDPDRNPSSSPIIDPSGQRVIQPHELHQFGPPGPNLYHGTDQFSSRVENGREGERFYRLPDEDDRKKLIHHGPNRDEEEEEGETYLSTGAGVGPRRFENNPFEDPIGPLRSSTSFDHENDHDHDPNEDDLGFEYLGSEPLHHLDPFVDPPQSSSLSSSSFDELATYDPSHPAVLQPSHLPASIVIHSHPHSHSHSHDHHHHQEREHGYPPPLS